MSTSTHVFVDTNVWLTFYSFSNDDLEQLRKLIALIKSGDLVLYTNEYLSNEFYRNRERKLDDSIKEFSKGSTQKSIPRYMSDYNESATYTKAIVELEKSRNALIERARNEASDRKLAADILFADILAASPPSVITSEIMNAAATRRMLGNPPGKHQTLGDQIHWEVLIKYVPKCTDLYIISKDGDFESDLTKGVVSSFLADEWKKKTSGTLTLHTELRPFLNAKFPDIKLATDVEKKKAIKRLIGSGTFATTHDAISSLSVFKDQISWDDADQLFTAAAENSQIRWIGSDSDVRLFYIPLVEKFKQKISSERHEELTSLFAKDEFTVLLDEDDEEAPF